MKNILKNITSLRLVWFIVLAILIVDQIIKFEVKSTMSLGESIPITSWFKITFIENNGMAYGMTFINKIVLSIFRLIAIIAIGYYVCKTTKTTHRKGYVACLALVLAGAIGNMIDSMFYGLIFNSSTPFNVSELVPFGTGYAGFLEGKVVDMFYFPLIVTTWPEWVPVWGGHEFIFFSPVFNFADAAISCGVVLLILFYRKEMEGLSLNFFSKKSKKKEEN